LTATCSDLTWGGEFSDRAAERCYRDEHFGETHRHVRLLFLAALTLNLLFLASDWRYSGRPLFPSMLTARWLIISVSLVCLLSATGARTFRTFERLSVLWSVSVIAANAILSRTHSEIALIIPFVLPTIYYLILPMRFGLRLATGLVGGFIPLAACILGMPSRQTAPGLLLGMLTLNAALTLILIRSNRLERQEWAATRAEHAANRQLMRNRETLDTILQAVPLPMLVINRRNGRILQANAAARRCFGDRPPHDLFSSASKFFPRNGLDRLLAALDTTGRVEGVETRLHLPGGGRRDVLVSAALAEVADTRAVIVTLTDITDRKKMEAELERLANTDFLTGLANRVRFFTLATAEIQRAQRYRRPLALAMIDIDRFKEINDSLGHLAGDKVLTAFAALCRSMIRRQDVLARLGGDEFALLLPETERESALAMTDRLRRAVADAPRDVMPVPLTVSIGLTWILPGDSSPDAALVRADRALYDAKGTGRNQVASDEKRQQA